MDCSEERISRCTFGRGVNSIDLQSVSRRGGVGGLIGAMIHSRFALVHVLVMQV